MVTKLYLVIKKDVRLNAPISANYVPFYANFVTGFACLEIGHDLVTEVWLFLAFRGCQILHFRNKKIPQIVDFEGFCCF